LTRPSVVAMARPASAESQIFTPASKTLAKQTTETARFEIKEISISPAITTKARPKAMKPLKAYGVRRSSRFARRRQKVESEALHTPTRRKQTTRSIAQRA